VIRWRHGWELRLEHTHIRSTNMVLAIGGHAAVSTTASSWGWAVARLAGES